MCPSRKRMSLLMNHAGFGPVTIYRDGIGITIPRNWIYKKTGCIKKYAQEQIDKMFEEKFKEVKQAI